MPTRNEYTKERSVEGLTILAQSLGAHAIFATENEIQVDLDENLLERFVTSYELLKKEGYLLGSSAVAWRSRSGNWHAVVTLDSVVRKLVEAPERIMYALMLGSDPTREILNLSEDRAARGSIVLFRPNGAIVHDVAAIRRTYEETAALKQAEKEYRA